MSKEDSKTEWRPHPALQSASPGIKPLCQRCQKPFKDAELAVIEKKTDVAFIKFCDILRSEHDSNEHLEIEKHVLNRLLECFTERRGSGDTIHAKDHLNYFYLFKFYEQEAQGPLRPAWSFSR